MDPQVKPGDDNKKEPGNDNKKKTESDKKKETGGDSPGARRTFYAELQKAAAERRRNRFVRAMRPAVGRSHPAGEASACTVLQRPVLLWRDVRPFKEKFLLYFTKILLYCLQIWTCSRFST